LKSVHKELREELKESKKVLYEDEIVVREQSKSNETANRLRLEARMGCDCFWGTYLVIEQAADASRKDARFMPHFRRWDGSGAVAVQIQTGMTMAQAMSGEDTRLRIGYVPPDAWERNRDPRCRTTVSIRIGTSVNGRREPIWATWPVILHRPLPDGAEIMWAKVLRERVAHKDRWSLHIVIRLGDELEPEERCGKGLVAMDIGWRKRKHDQETDGLRIGYFQDEHGYKEEVILEEQVVSMFRRCEELQSVRDQRRNEIGARLRDWIGTLEEYPPWFREGIKGMHLWKSSSRFAHLALLWRENRWDGDELGYELIETWRKKDKHLWTWESNLRDKAKARRRHSYRLVAARLARKYETLIISNFNLRQTQRHVSDTSDKREIEEVRWQQKTACCSSVRQCLVNAFHSRGGRVMKIPASLLTRTCHHCGYDGKWKVPEELEHTCEACGKVWDRDHNSTRNMLARYRERPDEREVVPTTKQAKWARKGRHKGTARKEGSKQAESQV
jgi:hypothetical protein